jgi:hypothetical protein
MPLIFGGLSKNMQKGFNLKPVDFNELPSAYGL